MHPVELFINNLTEAFKMLGRDHIEVMAILTEFSARLDALASSGGSSIEADIAEAAEAAQFGYAYYNPHETLPGTPELPPPPPPGAPE